MRYRPFPRLRPGMVLGQDILDGAGNVLMERHRILDQKGLDMLREWGFPGVYIDDHLSQSIEIETIIRPQIEREALRVTKRIYTSEVADVKTEREILEAVENIVEDIVADGDIMYSLLHLKNFDEYLYFHSLYVAILSVYLGYRYGIDRAGLRELTEAALLADIGKKFINVDMQLQDMELEGVDEYEMRAHTRIGADYIHNSFEFSDEVMIAVLEHHENYDGTGYPSGIKGNQISLFARIIHVADVYDALITKRPYREAYSPSDAVEYLMSKCGTEFDPSIVDLFVNWVAVYPTATEVLLSDGRSAIVEKNYPHFPLRPVVRVIPTGEVIDLRGDVNALHITIVKVAEKEDAA